MFNNDKVKNSFSFLKGENKGFFIIIFKNNFLFFKIKK